MRIDVYMDGQSEPFKSIVPPETFHLDTTSIDDGDHELLFKATDTDGTISVRKVNFVVRNGPSISVYGVRDNETVSGDVSVLANAYSSKIGDQFEPMRIETPNPIPIWSWLLLLVVFSWGMWYLGSELRQHHSVVLAQQSASPGENAAATASVATASAQASWQAMGKQVFENNCASCHQVDGSGLAGLFPALSGNPAVLDADPNLHLSTIINGAQGKPIDGVTYPSPMPPFGALLSDEEIAAVANHERTSWGNSAATVTAEAVHVLRE